MMVIGRGMLWCLALAVVLVGCGDKSPQESLAAAKQHLAKDEQQAAVVELKNAIQGDPSLAEARLLLGKSLLDLGNSAIAAVEIEKSIELGTPPDQGVPLLAQALLDAGDQRKVLELEKNTQLTSPPAIAELKTSAATAALQFGMQEQAKTLLDEALAAAPGHPAPILLQARMRSTDGDANGAMALVDGVLAKSRDHVPALMMKADLLIARQNVPEAVAMYRRVVELQPRNLVAHGALIDQLLSANDIKGAQAELEAMKKARPGHLGNSFFSAKIAAQQGDFKTAEDHLQVVLKSAPDSPPALQLAGAVALQRNELLQAEKHFSRLTLVARDSAAARQLLAHLYLRMGNPAKAIDTLQQLIDADPPDAISLALAGRAYLMAGDAPRAEELLGRAAKMRPSDTGSRTMLAMAKVGRGDPAGTQELEALASNTNDPTAELALISAALARRDYDVALKLIDRMEAKRLNKAEPAFLRGRVQVMRGDLAAAQAQFEQALSIDPGYFAATEALVTLDVAANRYDSARARLAAAAKARPADTRPLAMLAAVEEAAGKPTAEIVTLLDKAIAAAPDDITLRSRLVQLHQRKGDKKSALEAANQAVSALPNNSRALALLAGTQRAAGEIDQAAATYAKWATAEPNALQPLLGLADSQLALGDAIGAQETMAKALRLAPEQRTVQELALRADLQADKPDEALARLRRLQTRLPTSPLGHQLEGELEARRQHWPQSIAALREALRRSPDSVTASKLHHALRTSGDAAKADAFAAEWQKAHPDDAEFIFYLGSLDLAASRWAPAEARFRRVIELAPAHLRAMNNLAWVLAMQKKPEALEWANRINTQVPNQPGFLDTLATALAQSGKLAEAVEAQKQAVALAPSAHSLRLQLARLYLQAGNKAAARQELDTLAKLGDRFPQYSEVLAMQAKL